MVSRNKTSKSHIGENGDTSAQLAISYVRDFSLQANRYGTYKTDESLVLLNRCASLITAVQTQHISPTTMEISKFFIDLHAVMGNLSVDADALWACVAALQHCSRNLEARRAIIEEFRFLPLLASVLKQTQGQDRMQRLLTLLQELTYGIRITWEEPYVVLLLEQLVQMIYNDEEPESHAQLALSILTNLCYKNFVVLFLFLRTVNVSSFSRKIHNYGMLAQRMLIILSEDVHTPDIKELHLFLRSTFAATAEDCLKNWNVPYFRHIVEFLLDSKEGHHGLHLAMCSYEHYCEDIEKLLDQVEARSTTEDMNDESLKQQQICMSLLFQLIRYILELGGTTNEDGSENCISLDSIIPRIFELLCNWMESSVCGGDAVNLLGSLVKFAKKESISSRISRDPSIVIQLIAISEKPETALQHTTAIFKLLLTLLHQSKTEKLILSKISESFFDKMFAPLLAMKPAMLSNSSILLAEIEKYLFCLLLIINFANIAKKAYFGKCCTLLQLPQIQHALAYGMINGNEAVCSAVFEISQFENFPQAQVAKNISVLNAAFKNVTPSPPDDRWRNLNTILKSNQKFVSKELEERLHALIEVISNAHSNNQLNSVATSQLIELYNYKLDKLNSSENCMQQRLKEASNEITNLTQRINLQNAELQKYHTMNFELHISQEGLQSKCKDLKLQKDNLKRNMTNLMKKLSEKSDALQINEKRLSVKVSEMIVLQKDFNDIKEQLSIKTSEFDKLQNVAKENVSRIDMLKKTISAFEIDVKEKHRYIEEKERELAKTQKALDEQREAKKKSDGIITVLEAQLHQKNEEIRNYENELSEIEEERKKIMSLMESKKPKRK